MATTSTEAVSNSTHQTYRFGQNIISRAREKIWNGDIVATASTHGFWEPDKEFKIKVKVDELKRKFHQSRYLQVKHLPRDVSEAEIRQMLSDFPISSVSLSFGHGSAGSAKAYLEDPEMLEDWDMERTFLLRGQKIPVSPTLTELVLCVARYPLNYSESHFTGLVSSYGEVKMCFLMISEKTGESKGYGFVEYASKETALHAKSNLDGLLINDVMLCADFIDSTHITFESLHSKCLYVDNLPHNYRDMGEFRRKFSKIVNPPYCQIALKNGCPQNWGLVEFNTGEDAENTQVHLNGCELKDKKLRISYYIPGVRAINLYLKLLNETESNRGKGNGLLPTPPPGVFQSFKNLQKQNPIFAQSIQNIMVTEQQLGVGNVNSTANSQSNEEGKTSNKAGTSARKKPCPNIKSAPSSNASSESPAPDVPHEQQAAFLRLLAGQNPALLQTPQMASFLKQPKGALNGGTVLVPGTIASDHSGLTIPTAISTTVPAIPVIPTLPDFSAGGLYPDAVKAAAAPVNIIGVNPAIEAVTSASFPSPATENGPGLSIPVAGQAALWNSGLKSAVILPEVADKTTLNGEKNLLGSHISFSGQASSLTQRPQRLPTLLSGTNYPLARGIIPLTTAIPPVANPVVAEATASSNGFPAWFPQGAVLETPQFSFTPSVVPAASAPTDNGLTSLINQNILLQYLGDLNSGLPNETLNQYIGNINTFSSKQNSNLYKANTQANSGNDNLKSSVNNSNGNGNNSSGNNKNNNNNNNNNNSNNKNNNNNNSDDQSLSKKTKGEWHGKSVHSSPPLGGNIYRSNSSAGSSNSKLSESQNTGDSEGRTIETPSQRRPPQTPVVPHSGSLPIPMWPTVGSIPHSTGLGQTPPRPIGFEARWLLSNGARPSPPSYVSYPSVWTSNPYSSSSSNVTPVGQKRKYTRFLPSPEPSPEGNYIGQHSQGIGGHYLDSWPKRKKKN